MIIYMFATRDSAADVFGQPFSAKHSAMAIRGFGDAINSNQDSDISKHPEDFELYEIGTFDVDTGTLAGYDAPKMLIRGKDLKQAVA